MGGGVLGLARGAPRSLARSLGTFALTAFGVALYAAPAGAVCPLLAGSGDATLTAGAERVALMRDGNRTVVTLATEYHGPPEDFVMIVPVPASVAPDDVRTVPPGIFDRLDALTAPRLIEYWEEDPCPSRSGWEEPEQKRAAPSSASPAPGSSSAPSTTTAGAGRVEAQFNAGEYDVLLLPANDSAALDRFCRANNVKLPDGAQAALRPYAQAGAKLLVLRVDVDRAHYENGRAALSPIRFFYDEPTLTVPLRLGAPSDEASNDLVVYVLSPHQRFEAASAPNASVPTNLEVSPSVKAAFGPFVAALEEQAARGSRGAVLTEYAWQATACEPCSVPPLSDAELTLLGGDVIPATTEGGEPAEAPPSAPPPPPLAPPGPAPFVAMPLPGVARDAGVPPFVPTHDAVVAVPGGLPHDFVLTRLHARVTPADIGDDLELRKAPPIEGGREFSGAHAPVTLTADATSSFQARYILRHGWGGAVDCDDPRWGVWGGQDKESAPAINVAQALATATPDAGAPLATLVAGDVPAIGLHGTLSPPTHVLRRSIVSRIKDPWAAFAIGLVLGALGVVLVAVRTGGRA
jgi:hypothetical protein